MDKGSIWKLKDEMSHTIKNNDMSKNRFGSGTCGWRAHADSTDRLLSYRPLCCWD